MEFSQFCIFHINPDIIEDKSDNKTVYCLTIGCENKHSLKFILNFSKHMVTWDSTTIPMSDLQALQEPNEVLYIYQEPLEPNSAKEATKGTVHILDANHEKFNLQEVV